MVAARVPLSAWALWFPMKKPLRTRIVLGSIGGMALLAGCKDSTSFWRTLDGGAAPTADYRPSQQNTKPAETASTPAAETASQTSEPQAPSEPK